MLMLSEEEIREIEAQLEHYDTKRPACIEALKIVQRHRGYVSDEAIQEIAAFLDMTPDELDNVATFYNLIYRKPVGKNVILLCDSVSCWLMGYDTVRERIREKLGVGLGETTADGVFTLLPIVCLGTCDHAPAMMVNDELYRDLTVEGVDDILDRVRQRTS
jgi:NADH-quinone oxidoreductase subunit E